MCVSIIQSGKLKCQIKRIPAIMIHKIVKCKVSACDVLRWTTASPWANHFYLPSHCSSRAGMDAGNSLGNFFLPLSSTNAPLSSFLFFYLFFSSFILFSLSRFSTADHWKNSGKNVDFIFFLKVMIAIGMHHLAIIMDGIKMNIDTAIIVNSYVNKIQ